MLRRPPPTRLYTIIAIALVLAIVSPAAAHALGIHRPHKEVKQQIEELEQQWRTATLGADIPTMDRLLSEDYVGINWNGQMNTKMMQLDRLRNRALTISQLNLSDTKVKLVGSVAIVTARADVIGTNDGAEMKGVFRYTRVYQRLPSGLWKITNFEVVRVPDPDEHHHHAATASAVQVAPPA